MWDFRKSWKSANDFRLTEIRPSLILSVRKKEIEILRVINIWKRFLFAVTVHLGEGRVILTIYKSRKYSQKLSFGVNLILIDERCNKYNLNNDILFNALLAPPL